MAKTPHLTVEFYGIARARTGIDQHFCLGTTLFEVINELDETFPALRIRMPEGHLSPIYLISDNGERFITDLNEILSPNAKLLLLSADAGG
jgi:molybdopterin converting factor small subunit